MANPSHDNAELMRADFEKWKQDNSVFGGASLLERIYFAGWQQGQSRATLPSPSTAPMCERKTAKLEEEGYAKTGYVLRQPGKDCEVVVSDGGAVSWFTAEQWNWLMFNRDHVEFQWPKPVAALASRPAEVDDEGLPGLPKAFVRIEMDDSSIYGQIQEEYWENEQLTSLKDDDPLFTAEQYRQGQRDAVAADRARREKGGL